MLLIAGAIIVALTAVTVIATLYKAPSCSDGVQNQDESGVDCGGSCQYLCIAQMQLPTVLYTKVVENTGGTVDIVASVENKNLTAAAKSVPYTITVYGTDKNKIFQTEGEIDLPPGKTVPVFIPRIDMGKQIAETAFLNIESGAPKWYSLASDPRILPRASVSKITGTSDAPRIESKLLNDGVVPLRNINAFVIVKGEGGSVIDASSTIIPLIPANGEYTAVFTWGRAFNGVPLSIEIVPSVPLP